MICPKCLTIETEGSLRCRKCGAQLYTGVFQKPTVSPPRGRGEEKSGREASLRTNVIAVAVFAVAVVVLLVVMSRLETLLP
ncbi:MAG: hypothetical protein ACYC66_00550 [Chloroflexota bacterium]